MNIINKELEQGCALCYQHFGNLLFILMRHFKTFSAQVSDLSLGLPLYQNKNLNNNYFPFCLTTPNAKSLKRAVVLIFQKLAIASFNTSNGPEAASSLMVTRLQDSIIQLIQRINASILDIPTLLRSESSDPKSYGSSHTGLYLTNVVIHKRLYFNRYEKQMRIISPGRASFHLLI